MNDSIYTMFWKMNNCRESREQIGNCQELQSERQDVENKGADRTKGIFVFMKPFQDLSGS